MHQRSGSGIDFLLNMHLCRTEGFIASIVVIGTVKTFEYTEKQIHIFQNIRLGILLLQKGFFRSVQKQLSFFFGNEVQIFVKVGTV